MNKKVSVQEIASMIDHSLLHPLLTDEELIHGIETALQWNVASVCIKPCSINLCRKMLLGSSVKVCTVIGFPHGNNTIEIKKMESLLAIAEGAQELDMVINVGKAISKDWEYIWNELFAIQQICLKSAVDLKVIFETGILPDDEIKGTLTKLCRELGIAYVKTSTGFAYIKNEQGLFEMKGATLHDCSLMVENAGDFTKVKASGGIKTLDEVLAFKNIGVKRIGTSATIEILRAIQ